MILEVRDLHVSFQTVDGEVQAVRGIDFTLERGETLAIVGESGCGKSVTSQAIMQLLPNRSAQIKRGEIRFAGINLLRQLPSTIEQIRGAQMAMIFQDPMSSLNPTMTVGNQIVEGLWIHRKKSRKEAKQTAIQMLRSVGIHSPEERFHQYPHQLSGGMRQRVMIAMALVCSPQVLIADEPTTALDVTMVTEVIKQMKKLQHDAKTAILLITHDLGIVAEMAQKVVVMYAGKWVERGNIDEIFYQPRHPYTWGLLASMPRLDQPKERSLSVIPGSPPDLVHPPQGCPFAPRCSYTMKICQSAMPEVTVYSDTHQVMCWLEHPLAPDVTSPLKKRGDGSR